MVPLEADTRFDTRGSNLPERDIRASPTGTNVPSQFPVVSETSLCRRWKEIRGTGERKESSSVQGRPKWDQKYFFIIFYSIF